MCFIKDVIKNMRLSPHTPSPPPIKNQVSIKYTREISAPKGILGRVCVCGGGSGVDEDREHIFITPFGTHIQFCILTGIGEANSSQIYRTEYNTKTL